MKNVFALLLVALVSLSFTSCGNGGLSMEDENKDVVITAEQLKDYAEIIELNESNWKNYFYIETINEETENAFGEVVITESYYPLRIKMDNAFAYAFYNPYQSAWSDYAEVECTHIEGNVAYKFYPKTEGYEMVDCRGHVIQIDDFNFVRSSCKLVLFNIPEEYQNTGDDGTAYISCNGVKIFQNALIEDTGILSQIQV